MLWHALSRRLPVLALIYALALQGIAAGWTGAGNGPGLGATGQQAGMGGFAVLCRPAAGLAARLDVDGPAAPTAPDHDHGCAQACLSAAGGAPAQTAQPAPRRMMAAAVLSPGANHFPHLTVVAAAFAARAPPSVT
ncbi:hypothetical protein [Bradyrhizobium sp. 2TAF24]|uniref:hypothetical protein n=1 Tax=Bradyrhizobium sp. 2TAF24 TaxID=3233011 RepID=UPI003F91E434